eukprot:TRINITY_DN20792_c1_g1_i1.p1 TRINITY_DN20792_c1_g1~~TRINITY_DN20792_c1_g1_i1.p1  ORF type:complete len:817 (+),score=342.52 TRINITY_DN20792_c1_g1_i1:92-2452(+)
MARWLLAAALLAAGANGQSLSNALTEAQRHNLDYYQAPAFSLDNVTFSVMFDCMQNTQCWKTGSSGSMVVFDRDQFRTAIVAAFAARQAELLATAGMRMTLNGNTQIHFDRIVESTNPYNTPASYTGKWNVLARVTLSDIPYEVAHDFMPVIVSLFGTQYTTAVAALQWDSVWISTQAYFIDAQLEPFRGRGHKPQMLLIPLMLGLAFMLLIPIALVACAVAQQNNLAAQEKKYSKEETQVERLNRELADKEAMISLHQKKEDEDAERAKKQAHDRISCLSRELQEEDIDWGTKHAPFGASGMMPRPAPAPARPDRQRVGGAQQRAAPPASSGSSLPLGMRLAEVEEQEEDGRLNIERERQSDSAQICIHSLPPDHRAKRFLLLQLHRRRFKRMMYTMLREEKEKQKLLSKAAIGSMHTKAASPDGDGVEVTGFSQPADGGPSVGKQAGLKEGDLMVLVKYDDRQGQKRSPEPLEVLGDLGFAVGPAKEVYQGSKLYFTVIRGDRMKKAWHDTKAAAEAAVEKAPQTVEVGDYGELLNKKAAKKMKICRKRLAMMEKQGMKPQQVTVVIGGDTGGAKNTRVKRWRSIKETPELNSRNLHEEKIDEYMSNPKQCRELAQQMFKEHDADRSNSLDKEEIHHLFVKLAESEGVPEPTWRQTNAIFDRIDIDESKAISFEEFFPFFRRHIVGQICDLQSDLQDILAKEWKPKPFTEDKRDATREKIQRKVIGPGEAQGKSVLKGKINKFGMEWEYDLHKNRQGQWEGSAWPCEEHSQQYREAGWQVRWPQ